MPWTNETGGQGRMSEEERAERKRMAEQKWHKQRHQIRVELANKIAQPENHVQPEVQEEANHAITNHISDTEEDSKPAAVAKIEVKQEAKDWTHIRRCLGFKPQDICEKTLKATTQCAKNSARLPLRDHFKARSPTLNVRRLNENYATDTFFASVKA